MKIFINLICTLLSFTVISIGVFSAFGAETDTFTSAIEEGYYKVKNAKTGLYLAVDDNIDVNQQNVSVTEKSDALGQLFMISTAPYGYYLRPESSANSGRILNVDANEVKSGQNVNIFNFFAEDTLMWKFKEVNGGYTIHNANNLNCMLTVAENKNVIVTDNKDDDKTVWVLEKSDYKPNIGYREVLARGIDVSSWQGSIDWSKVVNDGIDFAILRGGFSEETDNRFEEYYIKAREAQLDLGCYFYTYATTKEEAIRDAQQLLLLLKGKKFEYPIYFDIEDKVHKPLTTQQRTDICIAFMKTLSDAGYLAGTYSSLYWYNHMLNRDEIAKNGEIWLAYWTDEYNTTDTYFGLWQYTSKGKVDGISGNVDLDYAYIDYPSIIKSLGLNGYSKLLLGDANNDNLINMNDIVTMQKIIVGLLQPASVGSDEFIKCDLNRDSTISMKDIVLLQLYMAKLIDSL